MMGASRVEMLSMVTFLRERRATGAADRVAEFLLSEAAVIPSYAVFTRYSISGQSVGN